MAKNKKVTKQAKRRLTVLTPLVVLAVSYLAFTLITTSTEMYQLYTEEKELKEELKENREKSKELKTEIDKLQDKDYVARYARENYLYTKDGEYVIKVDDDEEKKEKEKIKITNDYIIYGCIGFGILIILYIFKKSRKKNKKASRK